MPTTYYYSGPSARVAQRGGVRRRPSRRRRQRTRNRGRSGSISFRCVRGNQSEPPERRETRGSRQGRCRRRGIPRAMGRSRVRCGSSAVRNRAALVEVVAEIVVRSDWSWSRTLGRFSRGAGAGAERKRRRCRRIRRGRRKVKVECKRRRR
jgi:hypothetical protein